MKKLLFASWFLLCICVVNAQVNKVLLIGIDGVRPDALLAANTPILDSLASTGSYSYDALNEGITISGPGWSSLLTGVWPEKHGVSDNSFSGSNYLNYPHLFKRIEEYNSALHTVSIAQWHPINDQIAVDIADLMIYAANHSDYVAQEAVNYIYFGEPDAMFVHFDDVDHAGHAYGFAPDVPEYLEAIELVDLRIGDIINAMKERNNYAAENWAILVSTDHGGIGTSHGGNTIEERQIFLIVSGDSVPHMEVVADSIWTAIPPVPNCLNDSVELYFDGSAKVNTALDPVFDFGAIQDFTVECRVRTTQSGDVAIVTDKDWDNGALPGWVFSFNVNGGPWKVNIGDGDDRVDLEGGEIDDGEWHTLSATFDRDGMLTIYEDGQAVNSTSMATIDNVYTGFPISMGQDAENDYAYTGSIAEVRVFQGLVAPVDIDQWHCMPLDGSHNSYADLIGHWRMNEGNGSSSVSDQSPTAAHGSTINTEWRSATDTIFTWEKDFSNTPRMVDYGISALEHLCVPIEPSWNLDGQVFGTSCSGMSTGVNEEGPNTLRLYPTVNQGEFWVDLPDMEVWQLEVFNLLGAKVRSAQAQGKTRLDLGAEPTGPYLIRASNGSKTTLTGRTILAR